MLFTRCPGCQTTFRIAADTLRVANGAVRCGSCATVFSAYSGLRQDALDEGMRRDDKFLSPTLQTQELAGIEEIASPDLADDEDGGDSIVLEAQPEEAATEVDDEAQAATGAGDDDDEPIVLETWAEESAAEPADEAQPEPSTDDDELMVLETLTDDAAAGVDEDRESELPAMPLAAESSEHDAISEPPRMPQSTAAEAVGEASGKLQFDAPVDEWAQLMSEIEQSVSADAPEVKGSEAQPLRTGKEAASSETGPAGGESKGPQFWDVGEPFSLASWDTGEREAPEQATEQRVAADDAELTARAPDEDDAELDTEFAISAEEIDATLSADPDPELLTALEAGLGPLPPSNRASPFWTFGAVALLLLFAAQVLHHNRSTLASQPVIGDVMRTAYGLLGHEIVPAWDLGQYEITNWAATAASGDAGAGNLSITAQIRNSGPKAQPYPSIQLELKDRWEAVIGSRIFLPQEYLGPDLDARGLMTAGATVPAALAVVDPGLDASGFELDVCLETEAGRISCATDRVFQ